MNQWNKYLERFFRERPHSEKEYEHIVAQTILEDGLEWPYGSIDRQRSIHIGSAGTLIPDIILSYDGLPAAVFEIKAVNHTLRQQDFDQLVSYMRQCDASVRVLFGERVEVFFREPGKTGDPQKLLTVSLSIDDLNWSKFAELFTFPTFSLDNFKAYLEEVEKKRKEKEQIDIAKTVLLSEEGKEFVAGALRSLLTDKGIPAEIIDKVVEAVNIDLKDSSMEMEEQISVNLPASTFEVRRNKRAGIKANGFAYGLICEIINRNPGLRYIQLCTLFKTKSFIADVQTIKDPGRWFMNPNELIKLTDGTTIAVSTQWGFNNTCKPKMDRLREIAKRFGIDSSWPFQE